MALRDLFSPREPTEVTDARSVIAAHPLLPAVALAEENLGYYGGESVSTIVAAERMKRNEKYYANLPSWSRMKPEDTKPFELITGRMSTTNEENKRPKWQLSQSAKVISELMAQYLKADIKRNIQSEMYKNRTFQKYAGSGASSPINVEVYREPDPYPGKIVVRVSGPFWLKYFFYGRRQFILRGNPANKGAGGMLVFYDPHTGRKVVTKKAVMPEIKPGKFIEKAMVKTMNTVVNSDKFERTFNKVYQLNNKSAGPSTQSSMKISWNRFDEVLVQQLRTFKDPQSGILIFDTLKDIGRGRGLTPARLKQAENRLAQNNIQASRDFLSVVKKYNELEDQEVRREKIKVYAALRALLANAHVDLQLSAIKNELPTNLASRSTASRIFTQARKSF